LEYRLNHKFKRQKDPSHRNYLSNDSYPFDELPPFALGNFYILSDNLGRFLYQNIHRLKPVGTLEDLSVGFWLLSLGVSGSLLPFARLFSVYFLVFLSLSPSQVKVRDLPGICDYSRCSAAAAAVDVSSPLLAISRLSSSSSFQDLLIIEQLTLSSDLSYLRRLQLSYDDDFSEVNHLTEEEKDKEREMDDFTCKEEQTCQTEGKKENPQSQHHHHQQQQQQLYSQFFSSLVAEQSKKKSTVSSSVVIPKVVNPHPFNPFHDILSSPAPSSSSSLVEYSSFFRSRKLKRLLFILPFNGVSIDEEEKEGEIKDRANIFWRTNSKEASLSHFFRYLKGFLSYLSSQHQRELFPSSSPSSFSDGFKEKQSPNDNEVEEGEFLYEVEVLIATRSLSFDLYSFFYSHGMTIRYCPFFSDTKKLQTWNHDLLYLLSPSSSSPVIPSISYDKLVYLHYLLSFDFILLPLLSSVSSSASADQPSADVEKEEMIEMITFAQLFHRFSSSIFCPSVSSSSEMSSSSVVHPTVIIPFSTNMLSVSTIREEFTSNSSASLSSWLFSPSSTWLPSFPLPILVGFQSIGVKSPFICSYWFGSYSSWPVDESLNSPYSRLLSLLTVIREDVLSILPLSLGSAVGPAGGDAVAAGDGDGDGAGGSFLSSFTPYLACQRKELFLIKYSRYPEMNPLTGKVPEHLLQETTVKYQSLHLILGSSSSLYALSLLLSLLFQLYPSLKVEKIWVIRPVGSCVGFTDNDNDDLCLQFVESHSLSKWTLTEEATSFQSLYSSSSFSSNQRGRPGILFLSTFLDCAVSNPSPPSPPSPPSSPASPSASTPFGSLPYYSLIWSAEGDSDRCYLSKKSILQPDVSIWMNGEPNPLPSLFQPSPPSSVYSPSSSPAAADIIFLCHSNGYFDSQSSFSSEKREKDNSKFNISPATATTSTTEKEKEISERDSDLFTLNRFWKMKLKKEKKRIISKKEGRKKRTSQPFYLRSANDGSFSSESHTAAASDTFESSFFFQRNESMISFLPTFATTFYELNHHDFESIRMNRERKRNAEKLSKTLSSTSSPSYSSLSFSLSMVQQHPFSLLMNHHDWKSLERIQSSSSFSERKSHSRRDRDNEKEKKQDNPVLDETREKRKRKIYHIGYLYYNCQRKDRELFYSLLQERIALEERAEREDDERNENSTSFSSSATPVTPATATTAAASSSPFIRFKLHALGRCHGIESMNHDQSDARDSSSLSFQKSRFASNFSSDSISIYYAYLLNNNLHPSQPLSSSFSFSSASSSSSSVRSDGKVSREVVDEEDRDASFSFLVSFENSYRPDYISEKLINVFLLNNYYRRSCWNEDEYDPSKREMREKRRIKKPSAVIPIYVGAPNINHYFNSNSYISCSSYLRSQQPQQTHKAGLKEEKMMNATIIEENVRSCVNEVYFKMKTAVISQEKESSKPQPSTVAKSDSLWVGHKKRTIFCFFKTFQFS
jgi:hypothetical protein